MTTRALATITIVTIGAMTVPIATRNSPRSEHQLLCRCEAGLGSSEESKADHLTVLLTKSIRTRRDWLRHPAVHKRFIVRDIR